MLPTRKLLAFSSYGNACQANWKECGVESSQPAEVGRFVKAYAKAKSGKAFNLLRPMFTKDEIKRINSKYAAREDEGVYTARHYRLKLITLALSLLPFALAVVWLCVSTGNFVSLILVGTAIIGLFVFMFCARHADSL